MRLLRSFGPPPHPSACLDLSSADAEERIGIARSYPGVGCSEPATPSCGIGRLIPPFGPVPTDPRDVYVRVVGLSRQEADGPVRLALVDDYEVVLRGVAHMLAPFAD